MKALIVDDEPLARVELRRLLAAHPDVTIVGEAANVPEAVRAIGKLSPDLLFLDIRMPGASGFDLLAALDDAPAVIFTTAYDTHAIRAFEVSALDYLLKPIEAPRLAQALAKYQRQAQEERPSPAASPIQGKVFIKEGERCWFVSVDQIALFESEGNYTRVCFERHRPLLLRSLTQMEARLDPQRFLRVSRRQIVNLRFVADVAPGPTGGLVLTLKDDLKVSMSRRRAARFRQLNQI